MHVSSAPLILEGRQPSLLCTYSRAIRCPLEASSLTLSTTFQIPCQIHHSLPSIAAIPVWCPAFSCQLRNSGTTISCDPLTCAATSSSPFHLRSFSLHRQWPNLDHQWAHLMPREKEKKKLQRMLEDHKKLLYPNCEADKKKLGTTLELLQWKAENGVSDKGFGKLLVMIKKMLPKDN